MVSNIFWGLVIVDTIGIGVLAYLGSRGPSSPEGPVGGWLMLIPPILIVGLVALALINKSESVRMAGIVFLGFPWVMVVVGPLYSAYQDYMTDRRVAGDEDFHGASRKLAHAITAQDVPLVKSLIPQAGDLNQRHGEKLLLLFAIDKAQNSIGIGKVTPAGVEIVQALLDAGAKADLAGPYQRWPLTFAISSGPEITEMLLKAGANPNHLDGARRPLWWDILSGDGDRELRTLQVLLDHGADLSIRDGEGGPVGWAAYHARAKYSSSWRMVALLIDRGAAWKGERYFGELIADTVARDFNDRIERKEEPPEALRKVMSLYTSNQ